MAKILKVPKKTCVLGKRLYIPRKLIDKEILVDNYEKRLYKEETCTRCPILPDRHSLECESCPAYKGEIVLWNKETIDGKKFIALPPVHLRKPKELFNLPPLDILDIRPNVPIEGPLKFTKKLYTGQVVNGKPTVNQVKVVNKWLKKKSGIIEVPPRGGKCLTQGHYIMTSKGINRIEELFEYAKKYKSKETILATKENILTYKGVKNISHLYTKKVNCTIKVTLPWTTIEGPPHHQMLVADLSGVIAWKHLEQITKDDYLIFKKHNTWLGKTTKLANFKFIRNKKDTSSKEIKTPDNLTPELSRLLGYLIADGGLTIANSIKLSSGNTVVKKDYVKCLEKCFPELEYNSTLNGERVGEIQFNSVYIKKWLGEICGFNSFASAAQKSIPKCIMQAPKHLVLHFLSAYLSCDSEFKNGMHLCSASKRLIDDLTAVMVYLNIIPTSRSSKKSYARNGLNIKRTYYSVFFNATETLKLLPQLTLRKIYTLNTKSQYNYHDRIPGIGYLATDLKNKYFINRTWFGVKGTKSPVGSILQKNKNLHTRELINSIDFSAIKNNAKELYSSFKELCRDDFFYVPIKNVCTIKKTKRVYDVAVPETEHYLANGLISHNTVIATYLVCELQVKTVIIAHQFDFLRQFYETFVGGGSKRIAVTNLEKVDNKNDRIRLVTKLSDFKDIEKVDIVLVNYQKFIRNKKAMARIKQFLNNRTFLITDEVHQAASPAFIRFIAELRCRYRLGLSATPDRKDNRSLVIKEYYGNVTAKATVQSFVPEIYIEETPYKYRYDPKMWVFAMKALAKNEKRNIQIVKMLRRDMKDGKHTGAILPVDFLEHAKELQELINERMGAGSARIFSAKCDRVQMLEDFDNGEFKVLIAIRNMIKQGIDLSTPSLLYIIIPMSADQVHGAPMAYQLSHRIATRAPGKPQPIVRVFVDKLGASLGCFRSLFWMEFYKHSHGKNRRYIIPPETYELAQTLGQGKKPGAYVKRQTQVLSLEL